MREQIQRLVPAALRQKSPLRADGVITRVGGRFRLKLVLRWGEVSGERSIDADSCEDLAGAAAVALGLLMQAAEPSEAGVTSGPSTSEPEQAGGRQDSGRRAAPASRNAERPRAPERSPETNTPEPDRPGSERAWHALLQAPLATVDVGPLPQPSLGAAIAGGLSVHAWRFLLNAQVSQSQAIALSPSSGADVQRMALEAWSCRAWQAPPLEIAPCVTVGLERMTARGTGEEVQSRTAATTWISAGAGVFGRWYLADWLALGVGVGGKIEGARPRILVEGIGSPRQLGPAALSVRAGPEWIF